MKIAPPLPTFAPARRRATLAAALALLAGTACTRASEGLRGASLPQEAAAPAAVDAGEVMSGTVADAPGAVGVDAAADAAADPSAGGGAPPDALAVGPRPTIRPPIILSNPANPLDALGQRHNEGVEHLWQQRAQWVVNGRIDERKALALTIAWLCQSKSKLPKLPPWPQPTGPTFPTDPCDASWPTRLQALPGQRTLPLDQVFALAGYGANATSFVSAVLAEQAAGLASNDDPAARVAAIVRLEAGLRGGEANPLDAGGVGATDGASSDVAAGTALTNSLAPDLAAASGVTNSAGTIGGLDPAARPFPLPTIDPWSWCRPNCWLLMSSSVARHSLGYWWAERTSSAAERWKIVYDFPTARSAAPTPTPKPKDWGTIGKADVQGAVAGGAVGGFWGGLIGAVLFSAVEGFTQ